MLKKKKMKDDVRDKEDKEEVVEEELESTTVEEQAAEYLDNWKRSVAEFENYKKSKMNLERDMAGRAVEDFAYRLLPVVDNFHSSTDHIPEDQRDGGWVQGIMYIQKQLDQVLSEMGVEEIMVNEGDVFDPALHEAVEAHDSQSTNNEREAPIIDNGEKIGDMEDCKEESEHFSKSDDAVIAKEVSKIKKVLMKGYKRGDRVVRPARVIVE